MPEESGHQKGYIAIVETDDLIRDRNASLRSKPHCRLCAFGSVPVSRKARRTELTIPIADQST